MAIMRATRTVTASIRREGDGYVSLCPELNVASQGDTVEQARTNLAEAVRLLLKAADQTEIARRFRSRLPRVLFEQGSMPCPGAGGR